MEESKPLQDVVDGLTELAEQWKNAPPIGWRPLLKGYVYGWAQLHVGLWVRDTLDLPGFSYLAHPPDLCLSFEWPRGALGDDLEVETQRRIERFYRENVGECDGRIDQMRVAMLVDVPEFVKHSEGFVPGGVLPCTKRLQRLEACQECRVDFHELFASHPSPPLAAQTDRACNLSPRITKEDGVGGRLESERSLVLDAQRPDELVESGAQVMHDVADDRPPLVRGGGARASAQTMMSAPPFSGLLQTSGSA